MFKLITSQRKSNLLKEPEIFIPDKNSFLGKAFQKYVDEANESFNTKYVQGIKNGNLNPNDYGKFIVEDSYYCMHGVKTLEIAYNNAKNFPEVQEMLGKVRDAYKDYTDKVFIEQWHILKEDSVSVRVHLRQYTDFERYVAEKRHPILTLVTLLPCYYLWSWLAWKMYDKVENNIYGSWITENLDMESSKVISDTIDTYIRNYNDFDTELAFDCFRNSMVYEKINFLYATDSISDL